MSGWEIFWAIVIAFSLLSFSYMSARMLYFGLPELKEMFTSLSDEAHRRKGNQK
jgi:hypothetical protein